MEPRSDLDAALLIDLVRNFKAPLPTRTSPLDDRTRRVYSAGVIFAGLHDTELRT